MTKPAAAAGCDEGVLYSKVRVAERECWSKRWKDEARCALGGKWERQKWWERTWAEYETGR